jgi:hypothetical protein
MAFFAGAGAGLISGGLGLLGGLFSKGPSISPEQQRLLQMQMQAARGLQDYSRGVPGSDPQELAAMASQRGLLGQQQRGLMGGLFSNLGAGGSPAPMDMMGNLATQFQGQQAGAMSGLFGQFLQSRKNAILQSAQAAAGALPAAQPNVPGFNIGEVLGQLGQQLMYQNAMKQWQGQQRQPLPGAQGMPGTVNVGSGASGFNFGGGLGLGAVTLDPGKLRMPGRYP